MHIESITIKNYRVFRDVTLKNIPKLCVLVGANGTGKTTLFDVFSFLKDALTMNVGKAVAKRGGYKEVASRGFSAEAIFIELKFRLPIANHERVVTYQLTLKPDASGRVIVEREILKYKRGAYGQPFHFLNFSLGKGYAIINEDDFSKKDEELTREDQELDSPDILAIKGLGQFEKFKAASAFRQLLENWHISDFHISDARTVQEEGLAEHLSSRGENLALVANHIKEKHPAEFARIIDAMKRRIPGVTSVESITTEDSRLILRFQDGNFKDPFIARYVSDGTIKMFAYLVLLYDPTPFPILAVEEPENQLYPELLRHLVEEFRDYSRRGGQVFISTHSPELLNGLKLDEIFSIKKQSGFSTIQAAKEDPVLVGLVAEGDLPGALWRQGLFTGLNHL